MTWTVRKLTSGTDLEVFHAHSYYDIHVFDSSSRYVVAFEPRFEGRAPTIDDAVDVGIIDTDRHDENWRAVGSSTAWSWQQGPMAQWLPGRRAVVWNDRVGADFVTRLHDVDQGTTRTLPRPTYALEPSARFGFCVDMGRLDYLRPGYGYASAPDSVRIERCPADNGIWKQDLSTGQSRLILSLRDAVRFLLSRLSLRERLRHVRHRYIYWFNHVKVSPDGTRFTVKLRWRHRDLRQSWSARFGVSLTVSAAGTDLRLLGSQTSHVIWLDNRRLYYWTGSAFRLVEDDKPDGRLISLIEPGLIKKNAHLRYMPGRAEELLFDTPYQEDIELFVKGMGDTAAQRIALFENHVPRNGPYRCDLHPCPSPDGNRVVVTSLDDGGRQIYLCTRNVT